MVALRSYMRPKALKLWGLLFAPSCKRRGFASTRKYRGRTRTRTPDRMTCYLGLNRSASALSALRSAASGHRRAKPPRGNDGRLGLMLDHLLWPPAVELDDIAGQVRRPGVVHLRDVHGRPRLHRPWPSDELPGPDALFRGLASIIADLDGHC
jgi:hypothetical protein